MGLGYPRRMNGSQSALVLGARNLGGSIAADLVEHGYRVAAVARSADSGSACGASARSRSRRT